MLADEVYEHLVFAPARHLRLATLPRAGGAHGHREQRRQELRLHRLEDRLGHRRRLRCATRCSARTSSSPSPPPRRCRRRSPLALRLPDAYFQGLAALYADKRARLLGALREAGLPAHAPEGSYFAMADIRGRGFADDVAFCRHLVTEVGVAAHPPQRLLQPRAPRAGAGLARFAFCKTEPVLEEARARLVRGLAKAR